MARPKSIGIKTTGAKRTVSGASKKSGQSAGSALSANWQPEQPRSVAAEAFANLRKGMAERRLLEGATTYAYLFSQLRAYLAIAPERQFPTLGGEKVRLSPAGESLDALAKTAALDIVSLCKKSGLPPIALSQVYDAMVPLYLHVVESSYLAGSQPKPPTRPTAPGSGLAAAPRQPQSFSDSQPRASIQPASQRPGLGAKARQTAGRKTLSLTPSRSIQALWRVEYEQRLGQLTHDLRQLLVMGPQLFGPIPKSKREYVEQLLALIEEHEHRYKTGAETHPFRFSNDEKAELENFCPAFKLGGLDWLEVEGRRSG